MVGSSDGIVGGGKRTAVDFDYIADTLSRREVGNDVVAVAGLKDEAVTTRTTDERVVAGTAVKPVCSTTAVERIVAGTAVDEIGAAVTKQSYAGMLVTVIFRRRLDYRFSPRHRL